MNRKLLSAFVVVVVSFFYVFTLIFLYVCSNYLCYNFSYFFFYKYLTYIFNNICHEVWLKQGNPAQGNSMPYYLYKSLNSRITCEIGITL